MTYCSIREEELKNRVAQDYFGMLDCTKIIGNIDFCVTLPARHDPMPETESLLWAEAKRGQSDIYKSIVQLILTIGKARTFDKNLPPAFLGAFDAEKIAFIAYNDIHDIFYLNDFNWNVAPSNYETIEFALLSEKVTRTIENNSLFFRYDQDNDELQTFIKNNFMVIYNKWLSAVNWDYIVERRDLLVLQDVRERKGSFFTPQIWVELSQKYLADVFGKDWQDEYYVWDCAAGTGNLLAGLTNKYNIWAYNNVKFINDWVKTFRNSKSESVAAIIEVGSDFQNQRLVRFGEPHMKVPADNHNWQITKDNLIQSSVYYTVRKIIEATWLNDRDQFLFPNEKS